MNTFASAVLYEFASFMLGGGGPLARSACGASSACPPGDTLLYLGADIDVQMVKQMQPWEHHAVFFDGLLGEENRTENAAFNWVAEGYARNHRNDPRPSYRLTSNPLRPCPRQRCAGQLTQLLQQRLTDTSGVQRVQVVGSLRLQFELRREPTVVRTLRYVVGTWGEYA